MYQHTDKIENGNRTNKIMSEVLKINIESSVEEYDESMKKAVHSLSNNMLKTVKKVLG